MIPDEFVAHLYSKANQLLIDNLDSKEILRTQFFRGLNPFTVDCIRHITIFNELNIIPKRCFSCYKVSIQPRTVVELFKLMVIFGELKPPEDNARKCMVECRQKIAGTYKGLIYCSSIDEAEDVKDWIEKLVSEEISNDITVSIKRGCSEYAAYYPEYAQIDQDIPVMQYNEEWQKHEALFDKDYIFETQPVSFNQTSYNLNDAKVMLAWLRYAATIGDMSYLKITGKTLEPYSEYKRPTAFQSIADK